MNKLTSVFVLFLLLGFGSLKAQAKFTTGDIELDKSIAAVTKFGRSNNTAFQDAIIGKYNITKEQATKFTSNISGGDLLMVFEIANEIKKPKEEIAEFYIANRIKKTWAEIFKELGIKDKSFEAIKTKVINNGII